MTPTMTPTKYANFPERDLKVVIGPNINAATTKALGRISIGNYEMSVVQHERGQISTEAGRLAMNALARELTLTVTTADSRDFQCTFQAVNAAHRFQLWITTPFESGQSAHLVWCKYSELDGDKKIGVTFKLSTGFTNEDILHLLKAAQKAAMVLPAGEPYVIKGNPPPRFAKKTAAPAAAAPAAAPESESEPAKDA